MTSTRLYARGAHENDHMKDVDGTYLSKLSVVMKLLDERQTSSAPPSDVVSTELGELAPPQQRFRAGLLT
jgi:hypothetical protein